MSLPTIEQAIEYVTRVEAEWNLNPGRVRVLESRSPDYLELKTHDNLWAVWVEADGTIYGEC